jgi:hypothetical protein
MNMAHSDKSECAICTGNSSGVIQQTLIIVDNGIRVVSVVIISANKGLLL